MLNKQTIIRYGVINTVLLSLLTGISGAYAADHPDFSGTWTNYRPTGGAGAFSAPGAELLLNAKAVAARDDFLSVTQGTNYGAGNACVGYGMPSSVLGSGGYPMELIQRDDQIFSIYEAHSEMRRIYIGDAAGDPSTFFAERNGYSAAHWEGDHLIVETTRLKTQVDSRHPHSNQAVVTEEYYFDEPENGLKILVAEVRMEDPAWLDEPFEATKRWQEMPDYHVLAYECSEPKWLDEMEMLYEEADLEMVQD